VVGKDAFITLNVAMEARIHIMRYPKFTAVRSRLIPVAALLSATILGGCVGYTGYPSGDYGYSHPNGYYSGNRSAYSYPASYYAGYPSAYGNSYNHRRFYSPDYNGSFNTYRTSGGGN
jgi:hypothetical protein